MSKNASEKRTLHKQVVTILDDLEAKLDEAEKQRLTDTDQSRVTIFEIPQAFEDLEKMNMTDTNDLIRFANLKKKYAVLDDALSNRVALTQDSGNFELFYDGRAELGDNTNFTDITSYKDEFQNEFILVTDTGNGVVYEISTGTKSAVKISDTKKILSQPKYIDYGVGGVYVFDEVAGMVKAPFGKNGSIGNFASVAGLDRDVVGKIEIADLSVITNSDNIYLLSPSEKAIMKSSKAGGGYSYPFQYISSKTFEFGNNLANDISIYALTKGDRGIERYAYDYTKASTVLKKVSIEGLDGELGNIKAGYTASLVKSKMFVFDDSVKRIIQFEKPIETSGSLLHPNQMLVEDQYVYRGDRSDVFNDVKELASDYNDNNLYVLDGNKIWKVKIK